VPDMTKIHRLNFSEPVFIPHRSFSKKSDSAGGHVLFDLSKNCQAGRF